ncbi:MAG: transposase [Acidiferrobacter sp.]
MPERTREAAHTLWAAIPKPQRPARSTPRPLDMWVRYLEAIRVVAPQALIVHDKFPCAKELNKAVDLVRRREHRELQAQGIEMLTKTRYLWLKNPLN